jgi:hypothetical protein
MIKRKAIYILSILMLYALSYFIFRTTNIEASEKDNIEYVIFPKSQKWIYYLFRPLTYIDGNLTEMKFHIGPHQE